MEESSTLEEEILRLQKEAKHDSISMGKIMHLLSGRGQPLFVMLLSLPFCLPIQIPGSSTPFGLVIAFVGFRMIFGKHIWLPKKLLSKKIKGETVKKITDKVLSVTRKTKRWIHPRYSWLCNSSLMKIVNGSLIILMGLILALPLPIPLSNFIAALSLFLLGLGMLEDDGVVVIAAYVIAFVAVVFLIVIALFLTRLLK